MSFGRAGRIGCTTDSDIPNSRAGFGVWIGWRLRARSKEQGARGKEQGARSKEHIVAQRRSRQMHGICSGRDCQETDLAIWPIAVSSQQLTIFSLHRSVIMSSDNAPSGLHVGNKGARKILSLPCRGRTFVGCA